MRTYYRHLGSLNVFDFIEACDRILIDDEWFPAIARIRAVAAECASDRLQRDRVTVLPRPLVCPACHGARWVRTGGYDAFNVRAGQQGSRVHPCPKCTTAGMLDETKEAWVISQEGGVPNEEAPGIDERRGTWRAPRTPDGRIDMEAIYFESRLLRGLDPMVDERPQPVGGWQTLGALIATTPAAVSATIPAPAEPVAATAKWSVDDVPFD